MLLCVWNSEHLTLFAQSDPSPTALLRGTATHLLRGTATPEAPRRPFSTATTTATPLLRQSTTPTPVGEHYRLKRSAASEQLPAIALTIRSAILSEDSLHLTVAFENHTQEPLRFSYISSVDKQRVQLLDRNGQSHSATVVDPMWATIQPAGGFVAGGANVGTLTFARPIGPGPYQLIGIFDYPPIGFNLTNPVSAVRAVTVPAGHYVVDATLFSYDEVLEPLRIHIDSVTIAAETVTVALAVFNTNYLSYGLQRGPTGLDATLLDAEQRQVVPSTVSPSLAMGITPEEGILPRESYTGTITFPRPVDFTTVQFVFPRYSPLSLTFDSTGLNRVALTADSNGAIPPTPTPQADIGRYNTITALLDQLATALLEHNTQSFIAGFTTALQPSMKATFGHLAQMPLTTVTMTLAPGQSFAVDDPTSMSAMVISLRYTLEGVAPENYFVQEFTVDFAQEPNRSSADLWRITKIAPLTTLPFWWTNDVVTHKTEHFLIFTRFDTTNAIAALSQEMEAAYTAVSKKGLPLDARYVTYVTEPEESFADFTGATNPNVLGVALSRYQINQRGITVIGQAFYINGANFVDDAQLEQRQSTITHELVHLALVEDARPFTPPWLAEGLAVYYAGQLTAADYASDYNLERLSTIDLPTLTRLSSLGVHDAASETTSYRYLYSGAVIAYLIEEFGEAQVLAFYRSYAEVPAAEIQSRLPLLSNQPSQDRVFQMMSVEVTDAALTTYFGLTIETLDRAVKAWLQ